MAYVYIRSQPTLQTVGHYDPTGKWHPDSDWPTQEEAAARAAYLNGSTPHPDLGRALRLARTALEAKPDFRIPTLPREHDSSYKVLRVVDQALTLIPGA